MISGKGGSIGCKEGDLDGWEIVDKGSGLWVDKGQQTKSVAKYSFSHLKQIISNGFSWRLKVQLPGRSVEPINPESFIKRNFVSPTAERSKRFLFSRFFLRGILKLVSKFLSVTNLWLVQVTMLLYFHHSSKNCCLWYL